jgi:hypothetical protein
MKLLAYRIFDPAKARTPSDLTREDVNLAANQEQDAAFGPASQAALKVIPKLRMNRQMQAGALIALTCAGGWLTWMLFGGGAGQPVTETVDRPPTPIGRSCRLGKGQTRRNGDPAYKRQRGSQARASDLGAPSEPSEAACHFRSRD